MAHSHRPNWIFSLILCVALHALTSQAAVPGDSLEVKANPVDVSSEDAIIAALYDVISGPAGEKRDWDRFRSLFMEEARLIPTGMTRDGRPSHRVLTVEGYISAAAPRLEESGFFEREISRKSDRFGSIAHVFSTYDSKRNQNDEQPFARGINSIQLYFDGTRWWIITIMWDSERNDNPIPEHYLN